MYRFAQAVAASGWAPKGMEKPEAIVVAIQYGLEVGLTPMSALQNIAVINGRPSMYGDAQLALIRASGKCRHYCEALTDDAAHAVFIDLNFAAVAGDETALQDLRKKLAHAGAAIKLDKDDQGFSTCTLREGGQLEFDRFTVADAKKADLWGKSGPWKQYPKRMLKFRARSFLLRDNYGDVLKGLVEASEAWDSVVQHNPDAVASLPLGRSSIRGQNGTPPADEQAQPGPTEEQYHLQTPPEPTTEPEPEPAPAPVESGSVSATQEQHDRIQSLLTELGWAVRNYTSDYQLRRGKGLKPADMTVEVADAEIAYLTGLRDEPKSE